MLGFGLPKNGAQCTTPFPSQCTAHRTLLNTLSVLCAGGGGSFLGYPHLDAIFRVWFKTKFSFRLKASMGCHTCRLCDDDMLLLRASCREKGGSVLNQSTAEINSCHRV